MFTHSLSTEHNLFASNLRNVAVGNTGCIAANYRENPKGCERSDRVKFKVSYICQVKLGGKDYNFTAWSRFKPHVQLFLLLLYELLKI